MSTVGGLHRSSNKSPCLPALTPGHSDDSSCDSPDLPSYTLSSAGDTEMQDYVEDDFSITRSHPSSPALPFVLPERLNPRPHVDPSTGRIPTPIIGSFPPKTTTHSSSDAGSMEIEGCSETATRRRSNNEKAHRIPSPISEDEMAMTPTTVAGSRLSRLQVASNENMDMDTSSHQNFGKDSSAQNPKLRSGTASGKKRFYMGYREDCPKCQAKVPGHNAHFLPF
ncbi:hypothetical protein HDK77DRAFT_156035 [Phyllosticta capitalensis]|uniref:Uncharacterized protein n=1 Tax=Phyllosticta capitalensis TaxID=121624 RepID=A0ABR1YTW6_9PEZI